MFKIAKKVPIPHVSYNRGGGVSLKYPFDKMEIGDSFGFSIDDRDRIAVAANGYKTRHGGYNFAIRQVSNRLARCWRIK